MVKPTGVHVAFAAGTGVLVFVDLVMMLALANLGIAQKVVKSDADMINTEKFKLVLYCAFPSRAEAVALELFEALNDYCKRNGLINFELILRLSKEKVNPERWTEAFVLKEMLKYYPAEVNRVWVCGPPVLNETFDRAFDTADFKTMGFKREQFEIL